MVYDPVVAKSRLVRNEFNDDGNVGVENVTDEPFLNDDPVGALRILMIVISLTHFCGSNGPLRPSLKPSLDWPNWVPNAG